ncbi:hypothetical protein QZH41_001270 [Actinostola sp. cb2023]|nr:hypothetical protein QZH41_001270 [Actinostola sp. cb2023]
MVKLSPVIDENGLLRIGGRLNEADLSNEERHPLILPSSHHVAALVVEHYHAKVKHQGRVFTHGLVRSSGYWIIGGKRLVNGIIDKCLKCKKLRGQPKAQMMADLPAERLTPAPPFSYVGLDVFGPWQICARRTRGGLARSKRWAVLFTCMTTRAIHVEVIESMDTSSFINALRRFLALRGPVIRLRSDCGTNFVGARNELQGVLKPSDISAVQTYLLKEGYEWVFNPPHASHAGGAWERMIGVARRVLESILADVPPQHLTHEVLTTLMAEVTAIVNARPLLPVSCDPEAPEILTPATLLTQKPQQLKPAAAGDFSSADLYSKQWRRVQHLANIFWSRWRKEYLPTLQSRRKWQNASRDLKEGDLVLLCNKDAPRNDWPLARVVKAQPGRDGKVREVDLETAKGGSKKLYRRPVTGVILLKTEEQVSHLRLPKFTLPEFSGDILEWVPWWDQFKTCIHENETLGDRERFNYLLMYVKGIAKRAIEYIEVTSENYARAIEALQKRYGRKRIVVEHLIDSILSIEKKDKVNAHSLRYLYDTMVNRYHTLESYEPNLKHCHRIIVPILQSKFPQAIRRKWEYELSKIENEEDDKKITVDYLFNFLRSHVMSEEAAETSHANFQLRDIEERRDNALKPGRTPSRNNRIPSSSAIALNTSSKPEDAKQRNSSECVFCGKSHDSSNCYMIQRKSVQERLQLIKEKKLCFNCLQSKLGYLTADEIKDAEHTLIKNVQKNAFSDEIKELEQGKQIPKASKIVKLDPQINNETGLLVVGGRLQFALIPEEAKHQVILPHKNTLTEKLVLHVHCKANHAGPETTLGIIRQRFWPIQGRREVKRILRKCLICKHWKTIPIQQKMAPLPLERVQIVPPFTNIGLDFTGPLYLKVKGEPTLAKAYICIFVCEDTRAVHLELTNNMTTEEFLQAYRRMVSRRGVPRVIRSDNQTTFHKAARVFKISKQKSKLANINPKEVESRLANDHVTWKFITERASHRGGHWERVCRQIKEPLRRVLGKALLTYTEMYTVLTGIEAIINSRPLTFIGDDIRDGRVITPALLAIGRDLGSVPDEPRSTKLHSDQVPSSKFHSDQVPSSKFHSDQVPSSKFHSDQVPSSKFHSDQVPSSKFHSDQVPSSKFHSDQVPSSKFHSDQVPSSKFHSDQVPSSNSIQVPLNWVNINQCQSQMKEEMAPRH